MADCFEGAGTLAGYRDANEGHAAAELRKAGLATLTYDSFAARRTTGAALQRLSGLILSGAYTLRLCKWRGRVVDAKSTGKSHRRALCDRWPAARVVPQ
jgi:hypothetical protein